MRAITLCADDYGQNSFISEGILSLVANDRLSAVSCLTTFNTWPSYAKQLLPYKTKVDIGLHFNLTENTEISMPLWQLMLRSHLHWLDQAAVENELEHQLDLFVAATGQLPDFIDGHQHVHHLPVIRTALLNVYEKYLRSSQSYLRIACNDKIYDRMSFPKSTIIALTGALALKHAVVQKNIPHNKSFAGIYNFQNAANYPSYFCHFLSQSSNQGLIMCHPGLQSHKKNDPLAHSRWLEYQYFNSEQFLVDCQKYGITLARYK